MDFLDSSVGKVSACNAGDPSSIPGSGRSAGEGMGYPLQSSWASLVAQLLKNLPAMWETWVQSQVGKIPWRRERLPTPVFLGFPCGSAGKESTCNAGEPGSIPGSGRSAGEGIDYPLQYSWASLVAQMVKNLPAMWETCILSLGWKDPLEEGTHPLQYSCLENPHGQRSLAGYSPWGRNELDTIEPIKHTHAVLNVGDTFQVLNIQTSQRLKTQGVESDKYV